ncbi:MAG: outer membrane beta-barrel protein, partial [Cytophagales bacterium]|nr:outer membrane beta-barrel protein [Cytophagales bacterium]
MNKIILSTLAIFFSFQVWAQDFFAGPKIGVAGTSFFTSQPENITPTIGGGFTGGGFFRVHNRYFFFQPELEYRYGTGNLKYSDGLVQKISYSCISVPVLLGLKMPLDKKNTEYFRAYGGGSVGLIFKGINDVTFPTANANYVANTATYGG